MDRYLFVCVLKILKHRIANTNNIQAKNAYILANNLLVYALQNNVQKIEEMLNKEGIK